MTLHGASTPQQQLICFRVKQAERSLCSAGERVVKTLLKFGTGKFLAFAILAIPTIAQPTLTLAQAPTVAIHGHVNNAAGQVITKGNVELTTDKTSAAKDRKYPYSFPLDANGDYKGTGIPPGDYVVVVFVDGKSIDFQDTTLKAGPEVAINFDMTRAEYLKALSPEERAAIEEVKKKNAGATAYNAKIADLNKTMLQARADSKAGKTAEAVAAMKTLTDQKPDEALLWITLGEVQLADANAAAKAARAAHTSPMDVAIVQKYTDATTSYQKGIDLNAAKPKPVPELIAPSYLNMGEALAKSGKAQEASDAYEKAVKANPTLASSAYYNEAATFYNAQKLDEAAAAAEKGIAADPKRADLYYIKAQSLIPKATVDAKTQKIVAPEGCVEAYQEYLELEPTGAHAAEVKDLLTNLGQPIKSSFKASSGKKKS
jgi:tetratricopeptide (TPR) repeat protein